MEEAHASETSVLTRSTRRHIQEKTFFVIIAVKSSNPTASSEFVRYICIEFVRDKERFLDEIEARKSVV
jgi:hypothetical protein